MSMRNSPLKGLRILALENYIAGPYGSMILGDLGAEVVKIEPPSGDLSRSFAGPDHKGELFYYLAFNRNKKSVVLNLALPSNKDAFYDLVKISDVVWDNFRPGVTTRLKINYNTLKKVNPKIICCSITGYGQTGPRRNQISYDIVGQAISGIMSITGESGRPPARCGPPVGDLVAGMMGVIGVLAAVVRREKTGKGERVETSLLDSCVSLLAYYFSYYFCSGEVPGPQGSGHLGVSPYSVFKTRDGRWIATGINWPRITRVLNAEWLVEDSRFKTMKGRVKHKGDLEEIMQEHFLQADAQQWLELFEAEDIAGGLVQNIDEAANDPQVLNNDMIMTLTHALGGQIKLTGNPIKMDGIDHKEYEAPPALGQHTEEVLKNLVHYSTKQIKKIQVEAVAHVNELGSHIHKAL